MKATKHSSLALKTALGLSAAAIVCLGSLLFLSPELDPSLHPISDYALGNYGWVLSLLFYSWSLSSFALAFALAPVLSSRTGKIGLFFLVLAGIGECLGGMFDVTTPPHGLAFFLGVPSLPIAAILITRVLTKHTPWADKKALLGVTAHMTWISILLMIGSIILLFIGLTNAGITPGPQVTQIPPGVISLSGWANRFLVLSYCVWVAAVSYVSLKGKK